MKNKYYFLSLFLILIYGADIIAQDEPIYIEIGESDRKGMFDGIHGVVGKVDDGFYVLRTKTKSALIGGLSVGGPAELYVDKYNNDLMLEHSTEIDGIGLTPAGKIYGSEYEFCLQDDQDNLYVYFSEFVKGFNSLYRLRYDPDKKKFVDEVLVYKDKRANKWLDRRGSFDFVETLDRSKFAIYSFVNERNVDYTDAFAAVYNRDLSLVWSMREEIDGYSLLGATFSLSYQKTFKSVVGRNLSLSLSNDGIFNIMRRIYNDKLFNLSNEYSHLIYSLAGPDVEPHQRFFDFEDTDIIEAMIKHDQNGELNLVGYIGDNRRFIQGVVFINMDAINLTTITERNAKLSDKQKEQFLVSVDANTERKSKGDARTKKRIDKGKKVKISARNEIVNVYTHEDNSTTIVGEYFDVFTSTTMNANNTMNTTTTYVYGDLKYINIGQDGEVNWVKNIHKNQRSTSPYLLSISDLFLDDKIVYIFNDFETRTLTLTRMDSNGNFTHFDIADLGRRGELENHWFVPASVRYLSENEIIAFAMRLLKTKLIKINI